MSVSSPGTPMRPAGSGASFANTPIRTCAFALLRWIHSGCFGIAAGAVGCAGAIFAGAVVEGAGDFDGADLLCACAACDAAARAMATATVATLRVMRGERGAFTEFLLDWGEGPARTTRRAARGGAPALGGRPDGQSSFRALLRKPAQDVSTRETLSRSRLSIAAWEWRSGRPLPHSEGCARALDAAPASAIPRAPISTTGPE